jgi:malate synthase
MPIDRHGLKVDPLLDRFIVEEALPGTGVDAEVFWRGFAAFVHDLAPENHALLQVRDEMQAKIDSWHKTHGPAFDPQAYTAFLKSIGYIVPSGPDFAIDVRHVDAEIASLAGPQLVVPVMNSRYALNAANARWGSLYDALYGTDAIAETDGAERGTAFNPARGEKAVAWAMAFLDRAVPLAGRSWAGADRLAVATLGLRDPRQLAGHRHAGDTLTHLLLRNNGLHIDVVLKAGIIADVRLESALTVIMDCEDSVAAVDAEDKVQVYRNWLGLMRGDLSETVVKNGRPMSRTLNPDMVYDGDNNTPVTMRGRALMLVRNVGHLMTTPAIQDRDGNDMPEGLMDAMMTSLIALHDIGPKGRRANSPVGSMYIVKPKMHGPAEVAFAVKTLDRVEDVLGLARNSIKIGIMDEERRTTVNLKECIRAARQRVVFINTGFLDRTGDEMHTSMEAGPMLRKGDMKSAAWIKAYEEWNVDTGLAAGFSGNAQIGKGMWAMPDKMADMLTQKIGHPEAGANTAWVPSPTAATLHATHYHAVNVFERQQALHGKRRAKIEDLLSVPIVTRPNWSAEDIQRELDNNVQGILGYVVRWVDQGIGCSKVPDINNVGLMEDRATLRISAQHIANWLHHKVCSSDQVVATFRKMAAIVDEQNKHDEAYTPMSRNLDSSVAFQAACDLVFKGREQPSGYTEPLLHAARLKVKAAPKNAV